MTSDNDCVVAHLTLNVQDYRHCRSVTIICEMFKFPECTKCGMLVATVY